jgi:DNA-binding CsgD family transcriptional regulator
MAGVEFYITPTGEIMIQEVGKSVRPLCQNDVFIEGLLESIQEFYPKAFEALAENYKASSVNKPYYRFLMVRRFIKCNFGGYDNVLDIDHLGRMNFEFVQCPLRGECKYDHIICSPKFNTKLSDREMQVMRMLYDGQSDEEVSEKLFISLNTVNNHRKNSFKKIGIHSMADFIRYAKDNNLFK